LANIFLNGFLQSSDPAASVDGSNASDLIEASGALNGGRIRGLNGDDTLIYNLGGFNIDNSLINGNDGDDSLFFGEFLSIGDVFLRGTSVFGGAGDDTIEFGGQVRVGVDSVVRGDDGNDTILFETSNFALFNGNAGDDLIRAGDVDETINQTSIFGGVNNDTIIIDPGTTVTNSLIRGDDGDDSVLLQGDYENTLINGNAGNDTITPFGGGTYTNVSIFGGIGDDFINTFPTDYLDSLIRGDDGDDLIDIWGTYENTLINGNAGNDTIRDFPASTSINGTLSVRGGLGDDFINLNDTTGGVSIFGDDGNDTLVSALASDTLEGGAGADTFRYLGGAWSSLNAGVDRITDFVVGEDVIDRPGGAIPVAQIINGGEAATFDVAGINAAMAFFGILGQAGTFSFQGSTFLAINNGGAFNFDANDILIDITGVTGNIGAITIV
jgi:Ca2+-binding RTX toxin-like protein